MLVILDGCHALVEANHVAFCTFLHRMLKTNVKLLVTSRTFEALPATLAFGFLHVRLRRLDFLESAHLLMAALSPRVVLPEDLNLVDLKPQRRQQRQQHCHDIPVPYLLAAHPITKTILRGHPLTIVNVAKNMLRAFTATTATSRDHNDEYENHHDVHDKNMDVEEEEEEKVPASISTIDAWYVWYQDKLKRAACN
jgi:hypothetical protein